MTFCTFFVKFFFFICFLLLPLYDTFLSIYVHLLLFVVRYYLINTCRCISPIFCTGTILVWCSKRIILLTRCGEGVMTP